MNMKLARTKKGTSLVEVIVSLSIFIFVFAFFVAVFNYSAKISLYNTRNIQSHFLLQEGIEALKSIRNNRWLGNISALNLDTDYYLYFDGSLWKSTTTPQTIDGIFGRKFVVRPAYRGSDGKIAEQGNLDSNTKKITVYVSWEERNKEMSAYITNIFND